MPGEAELEKDGDDRSHLENGGELAEQARTHADRAVKLVDKIRAQRKQHVPAEHDDRQPRRDPGLEMGVDGQEYECKIHNKFVRQRVEDRAKLGFLVIGPRDEAVQRRPNYRVSPTSNRHRET